MIQTVRVFLTTGGAVDVKCAGFLVDSNGVHYSALGPKPEDKSQDAEVWGKFQRSMVAGFLVVDTQEGLK